MSEVPVLSVTLSEFRKSPGRRRKWIAYATRIVRDHVTLKVRVSFRTRTRVEVRSKGREVEIKVGVRVRVE